MGKLQTLSGNKIVKMLTLELNNMKTQLILYYYLQKTKKAMIVTIRFNHLCSNILVRLNSFMSTSCIMYYDCITVAYSFRS